MRDPQSRGMGSNPIRAIFESVPKRLLAAEYAGRRRQSLKRMRRRSNRLARTMAMWPNGKGAWPRTKRVCGFDPHHRHFPRRPGPPTTERGLLMGAWSNGMTPAWQVGNPGSIPGASTPITLRHRSAGRWTHYFPLGTTLNHWFRPSFRQRPFPPARGRGPLHNRRSQSEFVREAPFPILSSSQEHLFAAGFGSRFG